MCGYSSGRETRLVRRMAVTLGDRGSLSRGRARQLFKERFREDGASYLRRDYLPTRDGERFLVNQQTGAPVPLTEITIEPRGAPLHFVRGTGASATDEPLRYLGDDVFGSRDSLLHFRRVGGKVTAVRLDSVAPSATHASRGVRTCVNSRTAKSEIASSISGREVVFAVTDWSDDKRFIGPFQRVCARLRRVCTPPTPVA
jgi:hypothetical protein